ncbi:MAG TPA: alpha/beta hydrolase [Holophagaceae bacterium]|nr:alpha/beta hydrolase [Holophagaceae bacterium]
MRLLLVLLLTLPTWAQDLAFTKTGKGPGIILIHGFAGNRGVWKDSLKALSAKHTVLAVDLPGCGESPALPPGQVDFGQLADQVAKLGRRELDGGFVVVAHSMGGLVALRMASRHGESVRGVVFLDTPLRAMEGVAAETLAKALEADPAETFRSRYAAFAASPEQLDRVVAEAARVPGPVLAGYTRGRMASTEGDVARVVCPVLLVASPILVPSAAQPELDARAAGYAGFRTLQVVRLAEAKHWVMWDEPRLVNRAILEFVANLGKP